MRVREKEERVEFELFIADIYLPQKFEKESALSNGEGLLEKCLYRNVRKAPRLGSRGQREEKRRRTIYWEIYLWRIFKLHFTSPLHLRR